MLLGMPILTALTPTPYTIPYTLFILFIHVNVPLR